MDNNLTGSNTSGGFANLFSGIQNVAKAIGQLNQTLSNLGLLSIANTWTALQTFTAGITISGGTLTVTPSGAGTVTINPNTAGTLDNVTIGGTTAKAGTFTSVTTPSVSPGAVNLVLGTGAAIGLTATNGWVEIPSCAGTPTGVPANAAAGKTAIVYDSTGSKIWVYDGVNSAWKSVAVA